MGARWRVAVLLALVTTACGREAAPSRTTAGPVVTTTAPAAAGATRPIGPPAGPPSASTPPPATVPDALRFTAPGVDGSQVVGANFAGKDVALWFWAPW